MECTVALWRCTQYQYPERGPFHPDQRYPEAVFQETSSQPNPVYESVREVFRCVKEVGGLANDLVFPVAKQLLGPRVPISHSVLWVHHEDGIILDVRH